MAAKKVRNYPFLMGQGVWLDSDKLSPDDKVGEVLGHGTLTIGFIGLGLMGMSEFYGATDDARVAARARVLDYNEDDVRATLAVRRWLTTQDESS